jgi:hypothetical protein
MGIAVFTEILTSVFMDGAFLPFSMRETVFVATPIKRANSCMVNPKSLRIVFILLAHADFKYVMRSVCMIVLRQTRKKRAAISIIHQTRRLPRRPTEELVRFYQTATRKKSCTIS